MSRAEKKLAELKAKEELKKMKEAKRARQQQAAEKAKQQWRDAPKSVKTTIKVVGAIFALIILIAIFTSPTENSDNSSEKENEASVSTQESKKKEEVKETNQQAMLRKINELIESKNAFDTGSYVKGDIPTGEYAFISFDGSGKYYSEEDGAGNIIDNENFDSFGYVYVQEAGNLQTGGVLIKINQFKKLSVSGAKEIYEKLNDTTKYKESGIYKAGFDIKSGSYTIQSVGQAYVEVGSGPIGNNEIIDNENFNAKHSVNVSDGQYLKISGGKIL